MQHKRLVACASVVILAVAAACSDGPESPVPRALRTRHQGRGRRRIDAQGHRARHRNHQSTINSPTACVPRRAKSSAAFASHPCRSYQFESATLATRRDGVPVGVAGGSGATVSDSPTCSLEFDQPYTWRVRAVRAPARTLVGELDVPGAAGGFIRGNDVYDPLINGKTVGEIFGHVTFIPSVGVRLNTTTATSATACRRR